MKNILNLLTFVLMAIFSGFLFAGLMGVNPWIMTGAVFALGLLPQPQGVLMFNWASLSWGDGSKNMGGLKTIGYFALVTDVDNFPELPANPATPQEEITLESVTGFTMMATKTFFSLYSTMETSEIVDEPQGEPDGMSFVHKATMFYPGTSVEALAFAANVNNAGMVFIFEEASGTNRRVIGNKAFPAKVKVTVNTGKATADRKGISMEITSYGYTPAPLYTGAIPLV